MKHLITFLTVFLFVFSFAMAEKTGGKVGLGVNVGTSTYFGDYENGLPGWYFDGNIHWWVTNCIGVAANFNMPYLHVDTDNDRNEYFKSELTNYAFFLRYKPFSSYKLNPYLTAGYEIYNSEPLDRSKNALGEEESGSAIPMGFGITYYLTDIWAFNMETLVHLTTDDLVDGQDLGDKNDTWVTLAVGVSLNLGKAKDTDNDGIPDNRDGDPLKAEDIDGFEDKDGVPDPDNDMDGVLDIDDKAPLDPEDRDGFEDEDGVPDEDNDGDGIKDANDKAPNEAEDFDGFEDADGAPDNDNDNDGIADGNDKCPNEAETVNGFEDEDGCPDEKPEIHVESGKAIVLEGINFASSRATLTQASYNILDKVVKTMVDYPELEVEIRGYTDNTGSKKVNMSLSQKRAEAVKDYLVAQGVQPKRIKAVGYGPQNPIAPNDTKAGRAQNRRIEFFRIK
jgi:outer membrane protein OmpA-like peptidoglycan-associated protein